ncbi:hypothetical protein BH23PAT2_BH23PAT2_04930 [soil metagenome]
MDNNPPTQNQSDLTLSQPQEMVESVVAEPKKSPKKGLNISNISSRIKTFWHESSKKKRIIIVAILLALLIGTGTGIALLLRSDPPPPAPVIIEEPEPEAPPKPTTVASPLTGVQIKPEQAELPVTAVMVENSPDARPQSGLQEAGVVFEAMVEGGITRFMPLYQEDKPEVIGPIRSARRGYLDWLLGFDAALAHVGGSPFALQRIRNENIKDLDQFANPGAYYRSNNRFAPHNMYSSRTSLLEVHRARGYTSSTFKGFVRKNPEPADTPTMSSVSVRISQPLYNVRFDYDKKTNSYARFMAGVPHVDEQSNKQIKSDVFIVIVTSYSKDGIYSNYRTTGSGKAFIFQDGKVVEGTWEKPNKKTNFRFGDANGSPIGLNPGKTWITLATSDQDVDIKP